MCYEKEFVFSLVVMVVVKGMRMGLGVSDFSFVQLSRTNLSTFLLLTLIRIPKTDTLSSLNFYMKPTTPFDFI